MSDENGIFQLNGCGSDPDVPFGIYENKPDPYISFIGIEFAILTLKMFLTLKTSKISFKFTDFSHVRSNVANSISISIHQFYILIKHYCNTRDGEWLRLREFKVFQPDTYDVGYIDLEKNERYLDPKLILQKLNQL
jgi:hypothetical protein